MLAKRPFPMPRFTLGRMMVAVAVIAITLGSVASYRRYDRSRIRARDYASLEMLSRTASDFHDLTGKRYRDMAAAERKAAGSGSRAAVRDAHLEIAGRMEDLATQEDFQGKTQKEGAERFAGLKEACLRASRRFWLALPPDAPEAERTFTPL